jgi:hypothetical protein
VKRIRVQLSYVVDFPDDFDDMLLEDVDKLIGHGLVALLRKEPEQACDVLPDARLNLTFLSNRPKRRKTG